MAKSLAQRHGKSIAQQNLERLTGTRQIAWQVASEGVAVEYN